MADDLEEALRRSRESYERERAQLPAAPQIIIHNDEHEEQHGPPPPYSEVDPYNRQLQSQSQSPLQPPLQPPLHSQPGIRRPAPPVSQLTLDTQPPQHPDRLPSPILPRRPVSPRLPPRPSVSSSTFPGKASATHGNTQHPDDEIRPALPQRRY